jgi:mono/diheme cytochrome c family protein
MAGVIWAHGAHHHDSPKLAPPTAEEKAAFDAAKPVFEEQCYRCHTSKGRKAKAKSLDHLKMDSYPFGGHHAHEVGRLIRQVLTDVKGKGPTMPSDDVGAVKGEDLKKVLAWTDAFDRAHPAEKGVSNPKAAPKAPVKAQ